MSDDGPLASLPVISDKTRAVLTQRQLTDYREYKHDLLKWALSFGKDPNKAQGYSESTIKQLSYQIDVFYRWLWDDNDGYTTHATTDDADAYMREIATKETSNAHKDTVQKCIKRLFRYQQNVLGENIEWEPDYSFSLSSTQPRDFLTIEERRSIREAALEYGSVPSYNGLSPSERDQWAGKLAQRFDKPKEAISPKDFQRANGWKFASLVWTSLDTGLRPIEVGRAQEQWVDTGNKMLRIPKEESTKNRENWTVAISDRTATALERWLDEREQYAKYEESDVLWLTREGNPYGRQSLRRLLHRLCEIAGISTEGRQMSWYTIRHSVGTYFAREEDLAAAQAQLRHKSPTTTMRYDQVPVEDRRSALDRMG